MGDEFNGSGKKTYLRATQHNTYTPLPQHHVRVTPDFKQNLPKALGAMPLIMNPTSKGASSALKALGSMPGLEKVIITKNKKRRNSISYQICSFFFFYYQVANQDRYMCALDRKGR